MMYGPVIEQEIRSIRTKQELRGLYEDLDIVKSNQSHYRHEVPRGFQDVKVSHIT